ncbi:MAG: LamG domain-containing protein [Candidatus Marinimicrobia bacterium]|nr:LamG domain-containing protein [Candidatus Neomarinimicrobiota bacterium]
MGTIILNPFEIFPVSGIPRNGLVAEYLFSGNADDTSGNGHHGTVSGATLTTDRHSNPNSAYGFDGLNDSIVTSAFSRGGLGLTVSVWVNPIDTSSDWIVNQRDNGNASDNWQVVLSGGDTFAELFNGVGAASIGTTHSYIGWTHLLMTTSGANGNSFRFYINNVEIGDINLTADINNVSQTLRFGRFGWDNLGFYEGSIDDMRLYNRELTTQERTALFDE